MGLLDNTLSIIDIVLCLIDFAFLAYFLRSRRDPKPKPQFVSRIRRPHRCRRRP